jgi:L-threonylcarbamoyladenylate synthase
VKLEIEKAAEIVRNGGVILYPTDTVWGLGCDPNNEDALAKISALKKRTDGKSFILLVNNESLLSRYVKEIPDICYDLIDCADAPLTIVYPQGQYVSKKVMAEDGSIAIRITKNEFCTGLINKTKSAIVSTSANISGKNTATKLEEIDDEIKYGVDYIVDINTKETASNPSQIIKIGANSEVEIIRK